MIQTMKISLLIVIVVAIKLEVTAARTKYCSRCDRGKVRLLTVNGTDYLEYCYSRRWSLICGGEWGTNEARVACRQLGYENTEAIAGFANLTSERRTSLYYVEIKDGCNGTEDSIEDCNNVERRFQCPDSDQVATIQCQTTLVQSCIGGSIRLVSGSSYNEGRVEVCLNREWGTVCDNNQLALPGAVCQKLGFHADGATVASRFATESSPDNICTVQDESEVNCRPRSTTVCSSELGVECQRLTCSEHCTQLEDLQCENNSMLVKEMMESKMMNIVLGSLCGLLAITLLATITALVITCAALKQSKETASARSPQETRRKPLSLHMRDNPAYGETGQAYEIVDITNNSNN